MVYKVQDEVKAEAERRMKAGKPMQNSAQGAVRDILAEMAGVSHFRWEQAKVIIEKGDEKDKEQLRTGNAKINGIYTKIKNAEQPKESKKPEKACEEEAPIKKETSLECVNGPEDTSEAQRYDLPAPIVHLEQPIEVPAMEEMKKPEPRAFQFVKEQIQFAMKNMLKEVQIGLSWLREEDKGKIKELIDLLNAGADCAEQSIKEAGK